MPERRHDDLDGYRQLVAAILRQAIEDYRVDPEARYHDAYRMSMENPQFGRRRIVDDPETRKWHYEPLPERERRKRAKQHARAVQLDARRDHRTAERFLFGSREDSGFEWMCAFLDLDPEVVRGRVQRKAA